jgi:predicted transcriptional regulator
MSIDRLTATKPVNIAEFEDMIQRYNSGQHSKEREFAANLVMMMADDILAKLKILSIKSTR